MPPKRGIVKSGNAGNSSKASKTTNVASPGAKQDDEKPLFPVGSKYPASLLHERCTKEGWDKPQIDTFKHGNDGWSFAVTLSRLNKKKSERESVRFTPHPPNYRASAVEARHWGATYALYRFSNGLPLYRVLPAGPRDYWKELEVAHKAAPEHQQWMYAADPFAAAQQVKDRQAKVVAKRDDTTSQDKQNHSSGPYTNCPEVKMATTLREEVEGAIKEGFRLYSTDDASTLTEDVLDVVSKQLEIMGFQRPQIQKTTSFLSQPSPLLTRFLDSLAPLEAATEYLLLNTPECDLPSRFMPENNSSNPFISSAHAGTSSVKKRWVESRVVKEAGWPIHVVQEYTTNTALLDNWSQLIANLGKRLLGIQNLVEESTATPLEFDEEELLALGAELKEPGEYTLPSFTAPLTVHILFDHAQNYPRRDCIPMFISSDTVPSYVRLHILSRILSAFYHASTSDEPADSFGLTIMRIVDEEWALIEDDGPPDMSSVMVHMLPGPKDERLDNTINDPQMKKTENKFTKRQRPTNVRSPFVKQNVKISAAIVDTRNKLPAHKMRNEFLSTLQQNRVVVVVGETGSGKTTQLPQYILESFEETERADPYIIITQPRRISAISVAKRVSEERGNDGTVGYAVRGQSSQGSNTRLLFCTTGIVLRRLGTGDKLNDVTHVVVDEVHERSLDGDFLLLALKQLLKTHSRLKVVLMSATINHEVFAQYFRGAPVLSISGRTYPVTDKYLEDIIPVIDYSPVSLERHQPVIGAKMENLRLKYGDQLAEKALLVLDAVETSKRLDYQLIGSLVTYIIQNHQRAGILIFLPGVNEIRQCIEAVKSRLDHSLAYILPLHANLPIEEQNRVFEKTSKWKIIASTNVAETSITIDDIVYVIDSGKVKETRYVAETDLTLLEEVPVTHAAAKQRRGRAGRVQPGVCYKIYTRRAETLMAEFPKPEILRVPLEQVSLSAKMMNESQDVKVLLREVIDPPDSNTVDRAWQSLQDLGAIDSQDGLTPLGRHMALLPLDVRLAKMLILGTVFHCLDPILTISALLSSKPLFLSPMEQKDEAARAKSKFLVGNSDLITDLEAFNQCRKLKQERKNLAAFCKENFLSSTTLQEIFTLRREYCAVLEERGFVPPRCDSLDATMNVNSGNQNLLKGIILGGLWPRVARVHLPKSAIKFDKIQAGTIQRDNSAKEFKIYDLREGRVFIHPGSVLFDCASWRSPFLAYFNKYQSSKVFLRDATEMPMYALLLFGGSITIDHIKGGITIGSKEASVRLKALPRIGVLVNQLRQLLDLLLINCIEDGSSLQATQNHPVIQAILSVLIGDGMTE